MIDKIDNNPIPELMPKAADKKPNASAEPGNTAQDVSLRLDYAALIEKAMNLQTEDTKAVQQARELVLKGQLDTTENIREAADNIITFGV